MEITVPFSPSSSPPASPGQGRVWPGGARRFHSVAPRAWQLFNYATGSRIVVRGGGSCWEKRFVETRMCFLLFRTARTSPLQPQPGLQSLGPVGRSAGEKSLSTCILVRIPAISHCNQQSYCGVSALDPARDDAAFFSNFPECLPRRIDRDAGRVSWLAGFILING